MSTENTKQQHHKDWCDLMTGTGWDCDCGVSPPPSEPAPAAPNRCLIERVEALRQFMLGRAEHEHACTARDTLAILRSFVQQTDEKRAQIKAESEPVAPSDGEVEALIARAKAPSYLCTQCGWTGTDPHVLCGEDFYGACKRYMVLKCEPSPMTSELLTLISTLRQQVAELEAANREMREVVEKLPKTADGVAIILTKTRLYWFDYFGVKIFEGVPYMVTHGIRMGVPFVRAAILDETGRMYTDDDQQLASRLYSTRAAAEAALAARSEGGGK